MKRMFKVVSQTEAFAVKSEKATGGQTTKCTIVLQEPGGKFENSFVCTMLGNMATCKYQPGSMVHASLRFAAREYNGAWFQDVLITEIFSIHQ